MDHFIDQIRQETHGEIIGDLEVVRIPLNLYRARNATSRKWRTPEHIEHPFARVPVDLFETLDDPLATLARLHIYWSPRPARSTLGPMQ